MARVKYDNWEHGRRVLYSEFETRVRRYDPVGLLRALARFSASQPQFIGWQDRWRTGIPPWTVSAIARQAIISAPRSKLTAFDDRGFGRLANLFCQIEMMPTVGHDIYRFMAGAAHEQSSYQISAKEDLSRTLAVLLDTEAMGPHQKSESELDKLLGAPLRDLATSTFVLYGLAKNTGGVVTPAMLAGVVNEIPEVMPSLDSLLSTLHRLSASMDEARDDALRVPQFRNSLQRYGYNPLVRTPFLRLSDEEFVAPQTHFVLQSCSLEAIYYLGQKRWPATFGGDLGMRIEAYTGRQLRHSGNLEVYPEVAWRGSKSIDWFVVTPEATVLIECKSAHLTLDARAGAAVAAQTVADKVGPAFRQINRTVAEIRAKNSAFAAIPSDRPFVGLVVTAEPVYLANASDVRALMPTSDVPIMTFGLRDLESITMLSAATFGSLIHRCATDPVLSRRDGFEAIRVALGDRGERRNRLIDGAYRDHVMPEHLLARVGGAIDKP